MILFLRTFTLFNELNNTYTDTQTFTMLAFFKYLWFNVILFKWLIDNQFDRKTVVVGAGYIAVELAGVLKELGSDVTLLIRKNKVVMLLFISMACQNKL